MLIHLRLTVRTVTETVVFVRDVDLPAIPAVGEKLDIHQACGPYAVRAVTTDPNSTATCDVDHWDEPLPEHRPIGMENIQPKLWDLAHSGWRREV
jgi:hypothetical protein